jgi:SAM-dependent methyltransferase
MREDPFFPPAEVLMGEVKWKRICDLACGQGRVARYLADQGACVVGIDFSAKLLAIARRHEESESRQASQIAASPSLSGVSRPVWAEVPPVLIAGCRKVTPS